MKTVGNFATLVEAQLLKMKLGSFGIEAFIPNETSAGMAPFLFMNKTGIRVQVADEDEEEARKIVETFDSDSGSEDLENSE